MQKIQAVGIDLGTTYSCIAHLNEHGEPVTIPNQEGELSTPSVAMFDGAEVIVGTDMPNAFWVNQISAGKSMAAISHHVISLLLY